MKLLFDQNLSPRLVTLLADLYPGSSHVHLLHLDQVADREVWEYARQENFLIVTKDADFGDLCVLFGFPPKIIWIRRGNCSTHSVETILRNHFEDVSLLSVDVYRGVLTLF